MSHIDSAFQAKKFNTSIARVKQLGNQYSLSLKR